ncbi:MAG: lamin tail domain-containing protein [Flavobacteriales bacterium]|nr:lamin tail domain-containing protein [Flavobacteriales bacterium]
MKKLVLLSLAVIASFYTQAQQDCSELFISEYVVGSGNNRALELYNPTQNAIDLSTYRVGRFRDGAGTPMLLSLSGTIPSLGTYVIAIDKRDPNGTGFEEPVDAAILAVADTFVNPVYVQAESPFYFNGDDAVPLIKGDGTNLVDLVGKIGEDPGTAWSDANGTWWTTDKTLVRKASVKQGVTTNPATFMVEAEWDSLSEDTFTELGWHTCDCASVGVNENEVNKMNMFPNPSIEKQLMISTSQNMESIQVFNIIGQERDRVNFTQATDRHKLQLEHLQTGMYIVRVTLVNGVVISRKVMLGK